MNRLWPMALLLIIIFAGFYIWVQKEPYDPYSVDEIDKMLAQDPPWMKEKGKVQDDESIEEMMLASEKVEEEVDEKKMVEDSDKPAQDLALLKIEAKRNWQDEVRRFLENELNMSSELVVQYEQLRERYDVEKEEALKEFREKNGSKKKFPNKLFDEYSENLRRLFGGEHYTRYLELKHHFNKELAKKGNIEIEF